MMVTTAVLSLRKNLGEFVLSVSEKDESVIIMSSYATGHW